MSMTRREIAMDYFKQGYNCAQAVALAFEDLCTLDKDTLAKVSSSFGGGMGRLREVCGAVSGAFLIDGLLEGYTSPTSLDDKKEHYARIQALASQFKAQNGSIVCRELLGESATTTVTPEARTDEYYKKRPCIELVGDSAQILEEHLIAQGIIK